MATDLVPHRGGELEIPRRPQSRQLVQSIHLEERASPSTLPIALAALAIVLIAIVAWAALAPVDRVVRGPARVLAASSPHVVQDPDGGTVTQIMAREGQRVAAGDPLVRLGATGEPAEIEALEARRIELVLTVERLRALAEHRDPDFAGVAPDGETLRAVQQQLYEAEIESRDSQALVLQARVDEQAAALELARDRMDALARELPLLEQEAGQAAEEAERGARSPLDVLIRRRELQQVTDALAASRNEVLAGEAAIERSSSELQALDAELARDALERAAAAAAEVSAIDTRLGRVARRREGEVVAAPVDGIVSRVGVHRVNEVMRPGDVLFEVMPVGGALTVEARLDPDAASQVHPDQPATVQPLGAAAGGAAAGLAGTVQSVSGEAAVDAATGRPYHRIAIRLDDTPATDALLPGTAATAVITVGRGSFLESLLRDAERAP